MAVKTKDSVLEVIKLSKNALKPEELYKKSGIKSKSHFAQAIAELEAEGKIVYGKKGNISTPQHKGLVPAKVISQSKGFSFVRPVDGGDDIFVHNDSLSGALLGDTVFLNGIQHSVRGLSGRVERIVVKSDHVITGTVQKNRSGCELVPDAAIRYNIPVEKFTGPRVQDGDKVQAGLSFKRRRGELTANIIKVYGQAKSAKICADAIIDAHAIPVLFSEEILKEASHIAQSTITDGELKNRLDLREESIFTIDGEDAKDLDDAISVKKTENGFHLGVYIADVSHYVKEGSALDAEAQIRGTSVYFADRVIPMLPKELSNGVCSLTAGEDKLTFSALIELNQSGEILSYRFKKTVINSKVRGVYSEVNAILDGSADANLKKKYEPVMQSLLDAKELADILTRRAKQRGNMDIESGESKFKLDETGVCVEVASRESGEAEELIEQLMITANRCAAMCAREAGVPFVYRVHESPDPERLFVLSQLAGALGFKNRRIREGVTSYDLAELMEQAADTPAQRVISHQILRTMAKARYDVRPLGHFGLSLKDYCHFTSPIRRYPDTAIHRILSALVSGEGTKIIERKYAHFAADAASRSSACEVRAMSAEREAEKCYMAEYMTQHIGEEYDGVISGATQRGIFVALENSVEGFVGMENFPGGRYRFDGLTSHVDEVTGRKLSIGGLLRVQAVSADVATGRIDFVPMLESAPTAE